MNWLAEKLAKDGHAVALLSGELEIEQRADILNRFRDGKEKVLITTNVAARGIDIDQVGGEQTIFGYSSVTNNSHKMFEELTENSWQRFDQARWGNEIGMGTCKNADQN